MKPPRYRPRRRTGELGALEKDFADWADALAGPLGVLNNNLTLRDNFKGKLYALTVTTPDDWVQVQLLNGFTMVNNPQFGPNAAVRSNPFGECTGRGAVMRSSTPTSGTPICALPAGFAPASDANVRRLYESTGNYGTVQVGNATSGFPNGVVYWSTGSVAFIEFSSFLWRSATGCPPWPTAAQPSVVLGEDFPGTPEVVQLLYAQRPDGARLGPSPVLWKAATLGGKPGIQIQRVDGLVPNQKYTLLVAVLAA